MKNALIKIISPEEKEKTSLQKSLHNKQKILTDWMEKVESLRIELDLIKNEYDVRIGALLLKDNQLDLEIIQHKNLKRLMQEGMTYEEALKHDEDKFYNEILQMQKEQERIREEQNVLQNRYRGIRRSKRKY